MLRTSQEIAALVSRTQPWLRALPSGSSRLVPPRPWMATRPSPPSKVSSTLLCAVRVTTQEPRKSPGRPRHVSAMANRPIGVGSGRADDAPEAAHDAALPQHVHPPGVAVHDEPPAHQLQVNAVAAHPRARAVGTSREPQADPAASVLVEPRTEHEQRRSVTPVVQPPGAAQGVGAKRHRAMQRGAPRELARRTPYRRRGRLPAAGRHRLGGTGSRGRAHRDRGADDRHPRPPHPARPQSRSSLRGVNAWRDSRALAVDCQPPARQAHAPRGAGESRAARLETSPRIVGPGASSARAATLSRRLRDWRPRRASSIPARQAGAGREVSGTWPAAGSRRRTGAPRSPWEM